MLAREGGPLLPSSVTERGATLKHQIHVNQHVIKRNRTTGEREPVLTVKNYQQNRYGHEVVIYGQDGLEAARVVYRPDNPLSCGAHVWIETHARVDVLNP